MKAVVYDSYGGPEVMRLVDMPAPLPQEGQVRIANRAASLNPYDWHVYRADPALARSFSGWRSPGLRVLGADVAGVVDAVGPGVTEFAVGDEVYGEISFGGCAEYCVADAGRIAPKPASLSFAEAAALPMGALTSLQGLEAMGIRPGSRVLVIGASGGVGHLGVQIAKALGAARVVAVCSGRNADWVRELGADRVIDYTVEEVADCGEQFDVVLDLVTTSSLRDLAAVIAPDGAYAPMGGIGGGKLLGPAEAMFKATFAAPFVRRKVVRHTAIPNSADLVRVAAWVEAGLVKPRIDRVFPLEEHVAALEMLEGGHVAGKIVVEAA
ncbi:NAD(P)-dependent alcohol dehydrogenase [Demequina sp. NBRC 110054]|uniref:NAD(P)-dependent alcohol dehydrogenase n=1 Tax=Demequina sp. NBRC 110054 TaxID=1570343 RepID=UPI0009FDA4EB|nr:NAD(P)-dependent alcohol dehydrogenase [Demequina sp. NBRC 110054]